MIIHVTKNDIKRGNFGSIVNCPVGIALKRHLGIPRDWNLYVMDDFFSIMRNGKQIFLKYFPKTITTHGFVSFSFELNLTKEEQSTLWNSYQLKRF